MTTPNESQRQAVAIIEAALDKVRTAQFVEDVQDARWYLDRAWIVLTEFAESLPQKNSLLG